MSSATRVHAYLADQTTCVLGQHKRRHASFRDYRAALSLPIERTSLEPMAATMELDNVHARHQ